MTKLPIGLAEKQGLLSGACGIYSCMHALRLQGFTITLEEVYKLARIPKIWASLFGSDQYKLKGAMRRFGKVEICEYDVSTAKEFQAILDKHLDEGFTAIVCVAGLEHWAVIAARQGKKYVRIDSAPSTKIMDAVTWRTIREWFDETNGYYGLFIKRKGTQ